ncbi:MAG: hypothetical protein HYU54_05825, partial [Actinobacteria bacterium]|nr:hypothetical protein [Actinomycetota bacterium]
VEPRLAVLCARLSGGNLGRARRLATGPDGLGFRDVGLEALALAGGGPGGALAAAEAVLSAAEKYRKGLKDLLEAELEPFLDERGRPEDAYRGAIRRLEERHKRRVRRAERDYVDWVLLAVSAVLRDRIAEAVGGGAHLLINLDLPSEPAGDIARVAGGLSAVEEARAALAEDLNLNPRLVLEQAFLRVGWDSAA